MKVTILSGGVGGARLARGFTAQVATDTTVVVNVGDDDTIYGLDVSPDLDTVVYTLAASQSDRGWGLADDTFTVMAYLQSFGIDTSFAIGDRDLATNLFRTDRRRRGLPLSEITAQIVDTFGVNARVLPATDDTLRTVVRLTDGTWLPFQEYFVTRRHRDRIDDVRFDGAEQASPAPGVIEAIARADMVVIGPSNPPLSIWPILAVPDIADAVAGAARVVAVSPLFAGKALKGPAADVLEGLGLGVGNEAVLRSYPGLLSDLVIDTGDASDRTTLAGSGVRIHVLDTHADTPRKAQRLAGELLSLL